MPSAIHGSEILTNPRKTQQAALNIGIEKSSGEFIVRMDAHCALSPDYIPCASTNILKTGAITPGDVKSLFEI